MVSVKAKNKKVKVTFRGFFNNPTSWVYCILAPNKFPHSSPEAPRIIQIREISTNEGGNYSPFWLVDL
jgi:hypothetical protein